MSSAPPTQAYNGGFTTNAPGTDATVPEGDDIDAMIRAIESGQIVPKKGETTPVAPATSAEQTPTPAPTPVPAAEPVKKTAEVSEKKSKKDKPIRMIYSDTEFSPEERMSKMPRYAFVPEEKTETVLVEVTTVPGVAGIVDA